MKIDQVQLSNKLNTLFIHSPGCSAGTVQMWFRAGSALEKKDFKLLADLDSKGIYNPEWLKS